MSSVEDNLKKEKAAAEAAENRVDRAEAEISRIKEHMKKKQEAAKAALKRIQ